MGRDVMVRQQNGVFALPPRLVLFTCGGVVCRADVSLRVKPNYHLPATFKGILLINISINHIGYTFPGAELLLSNTT